MRKLVIIALAATLLLCGCAEGNGVKRDEHTKNMVSTTSSGRFVCDDDLYWFETVVDSHTGVTYLIWKSAKNTGTSSVGGITVLLNRDGTPVVSEEVK